MHDGDEENEENEEDVEDEEDDKDEEDNEDDEADEADEDDDARWGLGRQGRRTYDRGKQWGRPHCSLRSYVVDEEDKDAGRTRTGLWLVEIPTRTADYIYVLLLTYYDDDDRRRRRRRWWWCTWA